MFGQRLPGDRRKPSLDKKAVLDALQRFPDIDAPYHPPSNIS